MACQRSSCLALVLLVFGSTTALLAEAEHVLGAPSNKEVEVDVPSRASECAATFGHEECEEADYSALIQSRGPRRTSTSSPPIVRDEEARLPRHTTITTEADSAKDDAVLASQAMPADSPAPRTGFALSAIGADNGAEFIATGSRVSHRTNTATTRGDRSSEDEPAKVASHAAPADKPRVGFAMSAIGADNGAEFIATGSRVLHRPSAASEISLASFKNAREAWMEAWLREFSDDEGVRAPEQQQHSRESDKRSCG